jgi:hypothetical protein
MILQKKVEKLTPAVQLTLPVKKRPELTVPVKSEWR